MSRRTRWAARAAFALVLVWAFLAYLALPDFWRLLDPAAREGAMLTRTGDDIAGDPVNIVVEGDRPRLLAAMAAAGWQMAEAVTLESSVGIVESVTLDRPDPHAPVSPLYLDGRREDLAFEKPVGRSADRRQHVRFWQGEGPDGAARFLGSVTFDAGVSLSRDTGAVTHRIDPDIDAARDALAAELVATGQALDLGFVSGRGPTSDGRNGEGDPYRTDGRAALIELKPTG